MANLPVLVIGATGRIGREVVDLLVADGVPVRALARQPDASLPADVVLGDLTEPSSLAPALRGVGSVFLVWTAPPETVPSVVSMLAGSVQHVVYLSAPFRTEHPFFRQPNPMAELHASVEEHLAAAGVPATVLRPGMFASNTASWWGPSISAGEAVRWPYGSVATAPVDDRDVAAVAARMLTVPSPGDHVLTGPAALTHAEQVAIIGDVLGRPVPFVELTPDEFRASTAGTWPPAAVEMLLAAWGASLGSPAYVSSSVDGILGTARTYRDWVTDHAAVFGG